MGLLKQLFTIRDLQVRIGFTILALAVYRLGTHIPISGVNLQALQEVFSQGVLGFVNLFSGGALSRFSIFALGILPYINASIIMQLLTVIWPQLKELSQEGDVGRKQMSQYTKYLALGLAVFQGVVMTVGFREFLMPTTSFGFFLIYAVTSLVAGTALVIWIGELISEYGIGNGASLLIFVGIIAQVPLYIQNTWVLVKGGTHVAAVGAMVAVLIAMVIGIVAIQEAQRRITVEYAKRNPGARVQTARKAYIPLRLIQGGVLPIIFASALLQFPLMIGQYIPIAGVSRFLSTYYTYDGMFYNGLFCTMIFFFTFFYTAITFNPEDIGENIKKAGGFIEGVRPGEPTVKYLERIINSLTFIGAVFLALIAMVPILAANATQVTSFIGLGGTALLIIVGVAMDILKQLDAYLVSHRYEQLV